MLLAYIQSLNPQKATKAAKARYSAFPGFAGELGPICVTALGKNLDLNLTLRKAAGNANTNISGVGDDGRQKLLCLLFAER